MHAEIPSIFIRASLQINMEVSITSVDIDNGQNYRADLSKILLVETSVNIRSSLGLGKIERGQGKDSF